ncbi:scavenger receptor class F member 1-like [Haliotis cracherodii]|uniref:scavenger receptor class F member 1-like n=1 Tax=Haliotis cracherodii TaxID=6455 RepID=UPI0039EBA31D
MALVSMPGLIILLLLLLYADGVRQCDPGRYGELCDRSCAPHCAPMSGSAVGVCDRDTGRCHKGCVPGWHGVLCSRACSSSNCKKNVCNQANGHCSLGCKENYLGDVCSEVLNADGVRQCVPGNYGKSCDSSCPPHCAPISGSTVGVCDRDTGRCHEGCVPGWRGDHCSWTCSSSNCVNSICNQANGHCILGCNEKDIIGDFCTIVLNADGMRQCVPDHYGISCDKSCPPHCAPKSGSTVGVCDRDTGRCHEGCVPGWHGDLCSRACHSTGCIGNICNQADGHCTKGCTGNYAGGFCTEDKNPQENTGHVPAIISIVIAAVLVALTQTQTRRQKETEM